MNITLTAEERQTFEKFYNQRLQEAGGGRTFAADAEIVRQLLCEVREQGLTPNDNGGESFVRPGAVDWRSPDAVNATRAALAGERSSATNSENNLRDVLTGIAVLVAVLVGGLWYFGAFSSSAADGVPLTPTVTADLAAATPTPIPTLEADLLDVSGGNKTALVSPRTLDIGGVSFVVQPVNITSGAWQLPDDPRAVSWVAGTVVNYVFGVDATAENKALLAGLQAGDELLLRMSTGPAYRFAVADTVRVATQASEIFRQNRPGLTLVLVGDETLPTRVAIRAVYLPASELGLAAAGQSAGNIGDRLAWHDTLQVTVRGSHLVPGHTPPANYRYLAVDAAVRNVTAQRLDTTPIRSYLQAGGVMYAATAGLLGKGIDYPPLPVSLLPERTVTSTLVYAVPETVLRSGADWVLAPDSGSDGVRVSLPPQPDWQPEITFPAAGLRPDGTLVLSVSVTAPPEGLSIPAPAVVVDNGTAVAGGSPFPWAVPSGETRTFTVTLQSNGDPLTVRLFDAGVAIHVQ